MSARYISILSFLVLFLGTWQLKAQGSDPEWANDLEIEFLTPRVLYSSLERPKLKLHITNIGSEPIEYMGFNDFKPDNEDRSFPGCATFPNGGFINLEVGESTIVSVWSNCYFGDGLTLPEGTSDHIATFNFVQKNEVYSHIEEFQIVNDEGRESPASADGNDITVAGVIDVKGGYNPQVRLYAKTAQSREMEIDIEPADESSFTFNFQAQAGIEWYLVTTADLEGDEVVNFPKETIAISSFNDPENIELNIKALDYRYEVDFELRDAIVTPTGFWRGAVSETEETVVFIPGQENWFGNSDEEKRPYREQSTIYKYNFAGEKLWEYQPGYECWGGDMSPDGSRVVYQLVPNGGTYGIGVIDGTNGELMWKQEFTEFNPLARAMEGLETRLSKDASIVAVGSNPTGVVSLFDSETGELMKQFPNEPDGEHNWGQVRALEFSDNDEYLYVGSGDNYLRKVKVSDGTVIWKAFIGGWPFVNGLKFSSDGSFIVTGAKSFDQARVDVETGETIWIKDYGSLESVLSRTDQYVANFGGIIMDAETGDYLTNLNQSAEPHFFAGDTLVAKLDRAISSYYIDGKPIGDSDPSGGGQGNGEQSQWSYMKADGSLAIIAYRDMVTDPGNQVGIVFYTGNIQREELDPNDTPTDITLSSQSIDENNSQNAVLGTLSTEDADPNDSFTYEFVEGEGSEDNDKFEIENDQILVLEALDYETKETYSLRVRTRDNNRASYTKAFTITVNNINDAPTEIGLSGQVIAENQDAGIEIGTLSTTDQDLDDTHTYSLTQGDGSNDNDSFTIEDGILKSQTSFNYEATNELSIRIQTEDTNGGTFEQTFNITVTDVNDSPTAISLSNSNIEEGLDAGAEVGEFSSTDEDANDSFTYALVSGDGDSDNTSFEINGNKLLTKEVFDFDNKESYSIRVSTTDRESSTFESTFTISIDMVTSLELLADLVEKVYPNPASNEVYFDVSANQWPVTVEFFDSRGGLKLRHIQNDRGLISLDVSSLEPTIYITLIKDSKGHYSYKKVIIQK